MSVVRPSRPIQATGKSVSLGLPFSGLWPTMPPLQARHPARRIAADGRLTDRGRGLIAIQAAAECTVKGAEPTHHGRSPQTDEAERGVVGLI